MARYIIALSMDPTSGIQRNWCALATSYIKIALLSISSSWIHECRKCLDFWHSCSENGNVGVKYVKYSSTMYALIFVDDTPLQLKKSVTTVHFCKYLLTRVGSM